MEHGNDIKFLNNLGINIKRNKEDKNSNLKELLNYIENILFKNNDVPFTAYLQNQELIGKFRFNSAQPLELTETFANLRLLSKVCTVYFKINSADYDYYVFQEIKDTFNFIGEELFSREEYRDIKAEYSLKEADYHYQLEIFKYTFSLIEKIKSLIITMFDGNRQNDDFNDYKLEEKRLENALKRIAKDQINFMKLNTLFFDVLKRTSVFNYLRKLRNRLVHDYLNPNKKKNYNLDIQMLYILCFYTYTILISNIKDDEELALVYQRVNRI